ncbi:hypothetical protein I4U23_022171 [Adineta vaga]|nr:hypothetical protein I4U23_022171 [Adineta vaga]
MNFVVFAVWIVVVIVGSVYATPTAVVFTKDPPVNNLNLEGIHVIEEGIVSSSRKTRGLVRMGTGARWVNGIIPYQFGSGYTAELQSAIVTRMRKLEKLVAINNVQCILFRPRVSSDLYYITIQNGTGCLAPVGQFTGDVILQYPGCFDDGRTFHEFMHVLGIFHEQSREDRDSYVRIYPENMKPGMDTQYVIYKNPVADMFNSPYDYASIMHYGKYDFSKNSLATIEPLQPNIKIGQRYNLTSGDIQLVRRYYNCSSTGLTLPPFTAPIEPAFAYMTTSTYSSELTNQNLMFTRNVGPVQPKSCPIPSINATWNRTSSVLVNRRGQCLSDVNSICNPGDLFLDDIHDTLYVVDTQNNRIQKYFLNETYDIQVGLTGITVANTDLFRPQSIFVDIQTEDMYILDFDQKQTYDASYRVHLWKKNEKTGRILLNNTGGYLFEQFSPHLTLDKEKNIYVGTRSFIEKWLSSTNYTKRVIVAGKNPYKNQSTDLWDPVKILITDDLTLYIADWNNHRIQKWKVNASEGTTVIGNLTYVMGITMDCNDYLYFVDAYKCTVYQLNMITNEIRILIDGDDFRKLNLFMPTIINIDKFVGTTFQETIDWEMKMRIKTPWEMQTYGDIVCYITLACDSGLLCLDWRDICDGLQQCMFGLDEENCDKLEFNECENDEYRCLNGMCIPEEYFLDGDYDCLDLTDEKQLFNDTQCGLQQANYECDDRLCLPNDFSCGDGQCLPTHYTLYYEDSKPSFECISQREQYYMCETHKTRSQWTLTNGKCHSRSQYEEIITKNRSNSEECIYVLRCILSQQAEKNCRYRDISFHVDKLQNLCNSSFVYYPNGRIGAPYAQQNYSLLRLPFGTRFRSVDVNATIKCRGYMVVNKFLQFLPDKDFLSMESDICSDSKSSTIITDAGYDKFCYNKSRTFNNRPYNFIDICKKSLKCISAYRIKDGHQDCIFDEMQQDVLLLMSGIPSNTCVNIQKHRFRCSIEEESCLLVSKLGDLVPKCRNYYDQMWMGTGIMLSKLVCNTELKNGCELIKQYVEMSGKTSLNNNSYTPSNSRKNSFHTYCDTFWDMGSKKDEDPSLCHHWWICPDKQWQCRTGQCIDVKWVLDGEWDCSDASDEEAIFFTNNYNSTRNLKLVNAYVLMKKFHNLYNGKQPFSNECDLSIEYACLRLSENGTCDLLNDRPCINLNQIGDGHIDCSGAIDERNTLTHCDSPFMLGYNFLCIYKIAGVRDFCKSYSVDNFDYNHWFCLCGIHWFAEDCESPSDFICMNPIQCVKGGWCNNKSECTYGEDENVCAARDYARSSSGDRFYREKKQIFVNEIKQEVHLRQFPINKNKTTINDKNISIELSLTTQIPSFESIFSSIPYWCNRGIGVYLYDNSTVCFCPPQYYGDKCQFHSDRLTVIFHLNLSQSIYAETQNPAIVLNVLIIFLYENQPLMTRYFYVRPIDEIDNIYKKHVHHLFYSVLQQALERKRNRYFNQSDIINRQPYSVRIEVYEFNIHNKGRLVAVWLYPIYFDFLPSFRLAKVLRLTKSNLTKNPCHSNPCGSHKECYQVINEISTYVCLCPNNYKGKDCSIIDKLCNENFCAPNSLCKPNYQGLLNGNERPFCICPLGRIGHRCELIQNICQSNPCKNNGTSSGQCVKGNPSLTNDFVCICPECNHGRLCQFNTRQLTFTLDSLIQKDTREIKIIYLIIALLLSFIGGLTNLASFVTFRQPAPRKFGVGNYLLILSVSNQWSLFSLVLKLIEIFFSSLFNDISCKIVSYMLSLSTRYTYWLINWLTLERVYTVLFPFGTLPKKIRSAIFISVLTAIIIAGMHVHELFFYMIIEDSSGPGTCVANYPLLISSYNYVTVLIHYLVPFCIQSASITLIIFFTARSRSRANESHETFANVLKRQFRSQKELYITPLIIISSGLPQIIISSTFSCTELSIWQRHLLCITYFLSYAPQVLGFILFVIPSTTYLKEFQRTRLSKMFPFNLGVVVGAGVGDSVGTAVGVGVGVSLGEWMWSSSFYTRSHPHPPSPTPTPTPSRCGYE